jgi:phospholipid-binding lipoprotein MlaA
MKKIIILITTILLLGCSNVEKVEKKPTKSDKIVADNNFKLHLQSDHSILIDAYDPLEWMNRRMYYLNYEIDRWVALPASSTYKFFFPQTARIGVSNFFDNLYEPISVVNGVLTLNFKVILVGTGRFLLNTTIGIGGLFDVATPLRLYQEKRTLNDTLIIYGVGTGPYLIVPFLGPSDLRNISAKLVTFILRMPLDPINVYSGNIWIDLSIKGIEAVDFRSKINFRYYGLGTPFEYEYVRLLYLQGTYSKEEYLKKK